MQKIKYVIGIDEVGRGPLAGPVLVTAALIPSKFVKKIPNKKIPLRDSKKLSKAHREEWFKFLTKHLSVRFAYAYISPQRIDEINIREASNLAASRACEKLLKRFPLTSKETPIFLDGGLYLDYAPKLSKFSQKTVTRGDQKIPAVQCAAIIGKVIRDRKMVKLHEQYPQYGFDAHKGYGTQKHCQAIRTHGLSKVHRRTFCRKFLI